MSEPSKLPKRGARSTILQTIASHAPVSRASLARITGLSKQTVSESVAELETDGWITPSGQSAGHVGRRAAVYELRPGAGFLASADLGGTKLRIQICDLTGTARAETVTPTTQDGGPALIEQIAQTITSAMRQAELPPDALLVLSIGVPGTPDLASGEILLAPNIAGLDGFDFIGALKERLGVDILVENDVNLAAIGESQIGDAPDPLVYLAVGTGIGAGIVSDGTILRGAHGAAGEIAYLPFGADPLEPESLRNGALERVAASQAIREIYRAKTGQALDVPDIFDAAEAGQAEACATLDQVAHQIARAIAALTAVLDPGRVVLGGSIGTRHSLSDRVTRSLARISPRPTSVCASTLGHQAPLAGGLALGLTYFYMTDGYASPSPTHRQLEKLAETST